ncbi:luc7 3 isoform X3 [Sigmodon hispidus]
MEVCEVCGAFLIVGDAQSRVDDHLKGKQHMGYAKIKATVEELKEKLRKRTEEPDRDERLKKEKQEREEREKEREREREERERKRRRKRKKERKKELVIEKGEREVVLEVDTQAELLTAGPGTIKDHGVGTEGEAEVEIDEEAEAMTDQKENIGLAVEIEEGQKAEIESHINIGAKVGTENKTESPRKKKRGDLMIKKKK